MVICLYLDCVLICISRYLILCFLQHYYALNFTNKKRNFQQWLHLYPEILKAKEFQICKGKSPEVPFHRISLSYRYFEEFEFLRQFSKKQNMIKKKYLLNRNEKFVDKAQQCFAFLHIKPKFKFAPRNIVNLSHL